MKESKSPAMEGRINVLEGKISEYDRTFDMIREEIRGIRNGLDTTNRRIEEMDVRINSRIDSNFKWILPIQIAM